MAVAIVTFFGTRAFYTSSSNSATLTPVLPNGAWSGGGDGGAKVLLEGDAQPEESIGSHGGKSRLLHTACSIWAFLGQSSHALACRLDLAEWTEGLTTPNQRQHLQMYESLSKPLIVHIQVVRQPRWGSRARRRPSPQRQSHRR